MSDILNLEPKNVFKYFYELNQIPRGSKNEKAVSDYLVEFAKSHGLDYIQDDSMNVFIIKPASEGYENADGVIIQGHMDMVCSKNTDSDHDFLTDPIDMMIDGQYLTAKDTTLGADNGIAVAMGLALLADKEAKHPKLEVIITTEEEIGLTGAMAFDTSVLTGKYFLNLDSEEEGEFTIGCAGGLKSIINVPAYKENISMDNYNLHQIKVSGLIGGHSGVDIDKHRVNAIKLTGRILCKLDSELDIHMVDIQSGDKDNVIPREAIIRLIIEKEDLGDYNQLLASLRNEIEAEINVNEPNFKLEDTIIDFTDKTIEVITEQTLEKIIFLLMGLPNGIQTMSPILEGFVESSLNVGKCSLEDDHIVLWFAVRSSVKSLKYFITNQLKSFANYSNSEFVQTADYPEWPVKSKSLIVDKAVNLYKSTYGKDPIVKSIHAGLECGVFMEKRPELEAISLGPNMEGVHSPDEKLDIKSTERTYKFVKELIESLK